MNSFSEAEALSELWINTSAQGREEFMSKRNLEYTKEDYDVFREILERMKPADFDCCFHGLTEDVLLAIKTEVKYVLGN